jgi:glycine/D-amino acid oxidase-like deaminating enzyme
MAYDVIIIGAGIVGCACAREFALAGMRVAVIERDLPNSATTAAGMGHVVVLDDSPAQLALTRYSRSLWRELAPELPAAAEYEPRGTIWIAADEKELAEVHVKRTTYAGVGIRSIVLSAKELAAEEPNLRPGLVGALLVPEDVIIYPPAAAAYFLEDAVRHGAVLLQHQLVMQAGNGAVRLGDGTVLKSDAIVLATGVETSLLPWLPIQKRKGHLLLTERYPGFLSHQLVEFGYLKSAHKLAADSVAFNVQPRRDGEVLIGASRQYGNEDPAVDEGILHAMLERAYSYMPALRQVQTLRTWTGFRAATPDKLPLIGPTEDPSLFLAVGFEGFGITSAPGAARLVADHVLRRPCAIPLEPYLTARASWKEIQ